MKKVIYIFFALVHAMAKGQHYQKPASANAPVKIRTEQALEEHPLLKAGQKSGSTVFRKIPGGNRTTASGNQFSIQSLGTSVNPYTLAKYPQR